MFFPQFLCKYILLALEKFRHYFLYNEKLNFDFIYSSSGLFFSLYTKKCNYQWLMWILQIFKSHTLWLIHVFVHKCLNYLFGRHPHTFWEEAELYCTVHHNIFPLKRIAFIHWNTTDWLLLGDLKHWVSRQFGPVMHLPLVYALISSTVQKSKNNLHYIITSLWKYTLFALLMNYFISYYTGQIDILYDYPEHGWLSNTKCI